MQSRRNLVIATSDLVAAGLTTRTLADDDKTVDYVLVQTSKSLTVDISPIKLWLRRRYEKFRRSLDAERGGCDHASESEAHRANAELGWGCRCHKHEMSALTNSINVLSYT
jgi:hypothetical protein